MYIDSDILVGHLAARHPAATKVLHRHGIDFCCGGGRPLFEACEAVEADAAKVLEEIHAALEGATGSLRDWTQQPVDDLIDHILVAYHRPLDEELPRLAAMAEKVYAVHGHKDPERLLELRNVVCTLVAELVEHMAKEEQILFPMIRGGAGRMTAGPISVMEHEHDIAGDALAAIRELTDAFQPPPGACNTWRALWKGLEDLEVELHDHIHLENNILFPRALAG